MVFWAKELIELANQISDKMEVCMENAPRDENGEVIASDEVRQFNKYVFALMDCNDKLKRLLKESADEN